MSEKVKAAGKAAKTEKPNVIHKEHRRQIKMAHPVTFHANWFTALMAGDSQIEKIAFDFKKRVLRVFCKTEAKAKACEAFFMPVIELGREHLDLAFYPPNGKKVKGTVVEDMKSLAAAAFKGNKFYGATVQCTDPAGVRWTYLCMKPAAITFASDDLGNPWGMTTMLAETTAAVFKRISETGELQITSYTPTKAAK